MNKRPSSSLDVAVVNVKRPKTIDNDVSTTNGNQIISLFKKRHSLKAPVLQLIGHEGEIFSCKFHPSGNMLASCGMDRCIFLWKASGNCKNISVFNASHSNAILDINFTSKNDRMITCSADKTVVIWDLKTSCRLKKIRNHESVVNAIDVSKSSQCDLVASVGDDCRINIWDLRLGKPASSIKELYPLTSISFNKTDNVIFAGGIENTINAWDLRNNSKSYGLVGHEDSVTGLSLSPNGDYLLSNSMDNSLKSWDVRTFSHLDRLEKTFHGHQHNFEKNLLRCAWSPDGNMITCGSADRVVNVWCYHSQDLLHRSPCHKGSVNEVVFSPTEPLILSCSSDKQMIISEISQYDIPG